MAIDIQNLVEKHIKPALIVDTARQGTLQEDLPTFIEAQLALYGWVLVDMDDKTRVYAVALILESLIPRLALIFTDEIQEHREGPENLKLPDRVRFFTELRKAIAAMKAAAEKGVGVSSTETEENLRSWPGCGIAKWA